MAKLIVVVLLSLGVINSALSAPCPPGSVYINLQGNAWSCFAFVNRTKEFLSAEGDCQQQGGHLVSIHNAFENIFVSQYANQAFGATDNKYWIGINILSGGNWTFDDNPNQIVSFYEWAPGQPATAGDEEGCISVDKHGYWYSDDCFDEKFYVCEVPSTDAQNSTNTPPPMTTPTVSNMTSVPVTELTSATMASTTQGFTDSTTSDSIESTTTTTTAMSSGSPTSPTPLTPCEAYIPFALDASNAVTTDQYQAEKDFLTTLINQIFPTDIQPADYCQYTDTMTTGYPRQNSTAAVIFSFQFMSQGAGVKSSITVPLQYFINKNMASYGGGYPFNILILTGSPLFASDVNAVQGSVNALAAINANVTVVLMNKNATMSSYSAVTGLNTVVFDPVTSVETVRELFNCSNHP